MPRKSWATDFIEALPYILLTSHTVFALENIQKQVIAKIVVDELKKIKSDPFLFDTTMIYRGSRDSKTRSSP